MKLPASFCYTETKLKIKAAEKGEAMRKNVARVIAGICAAVMITGGIGTPVLAEPKSTEIHEKRKTNINENMKLWYTTPANVSTQETNGGEWMQESLPLGNGNLGNLIFGGIEKERIHFNEKTLWTGGPSDSRPDYQFGNKQTSYTAEEIQSYRELLDDKSTSVFPDDASLGGYGMWGGVRFSGENNLYKGSYQDFGDIWLDYTGTGISTDTVTDYRRELDLQTGIASTFYTYDSVDYTREHFVSYPDQVMVTRLSASEKGKIQVNVSMELNNQNLQGTTQMQEADCTCTISGIVKDNGLQFRTTMKIVAKGGKVTADQQSKSYQIQGADEVMIIMAAETDYKNDYPKYRDYEKNLSETVDGRVNSCARKTYRELLERHLEDHQTLFDRVSLDLGEVNTTKPTNELVDAYRNGEYSKYLETIAFQYGRYLTIAGSRGTLPSNLVGLWTVGDSAWTGDYHFNVNVQMNYWPVYVTNLAECGTTFVDYMENLREPGRLTAERVHGIENAVEEHTGFTVHTENNPFGMTAPTNAQEYGWNPTGAAWAVQNLWWHYEFTQDKEYLENTIYPIMKEAALFWDQYLWTSSYQVIHDESSPYNGQSRLVVAPSFSEEQGPTAIGTTYDQSLVWELYKECIQAGKILGEDEALLASWEEKMQKLDPIEINETNGIKEWYEETRVGTENGHHQSYAQAGTLGEIAVPNSGWNIGHPGEQRHASHLVGLFPGTLINKENEEYMEAAITSLTERGVYSTGWSKANKINLWARTENGDQAYELLKNLIGGNASGLQYNLFNSHGSGGGETMKNGTPVWQIDGNYGLTSGMAEMLLQSQNGYTQFLPAIPEDWEEGNVQGLKARGNFTIGESWAHQVAESFTVCYEGDQESSEFIGSYENITNAKVYANGKEIQVTKDTEKEQISFQAVKGTLYEIDFSNVNREELCKQAKKFLEEMDPDLTEAKKKLQETMEDPSADVGEMLTKAKKINALYGRYQEVEDVIYYLTEQDGFTELEIDKMYTNLRGLRILLLDKIAGIEAYESYEEKFQEIEEILKKQLENRIIVFSKKSGLLTENDTELILTKKDPSSVYEIRYTTDGSVPGKDSCVYTGKISLAKGNDQVIKAALFYGEQRVSPVYTEKYVTQKVQIEGVCVSHTNDWGSVYTKEKMIDGDTKTRWASKAVDTTKPLEIELTLKEKETITQLNFDFFVSGNNDIQGFEILVKTEEGYESIYEDTKMGTLSDKIGEVDGGSGGYHAYYEAKFPAVATDSIKVILKPGFLGEPSFYEITPYDLSLEEETTGDPTELNRWIRLAKYADRNSSCYQNAPAALQSAFEESFLDAKESREGTQEQIDLRVAFLKNRYERIEFHLALEKEFTDVTDKSSYFYDAVYWGTKQAIATGTGEGIFEPYEKVTRAQMACFLYRMAGEPEVTGTHPFKDIKANAYYEDAVIWAYQNQLIKGTSATTFSPNEEATRCEIVTLLYRFSNEPMITGEQTFKDVKEGSYYYKAVEWAVRENITTGFSADRFGPKETCTRGQAITFLYKWDMQKTN